MEAVAKLRNIPTSPRKMRLVADVIRGEKVNNALNILKFESKHCSRDLEKLLLSAIANWENKNEDARVEDADLFIKEIFVDGGRMLKRLQPAPQGRAHRIRKRSNHVTIVVDSLNPIEAPVKEAKEEPKAKTTKKDSAKEDKAAPKKEAAKKPAAKKAAPKAEAKKAAPKKEAAPKAEKKSAPKKEDKKKDDK